VTDNSSTASQVPPELNTNVPQTARIWNYWLGGKDNFPVDRQVGDQILEAFPAIVENARASRAFLARAVHYLAGDAGIRQFLDIGTGLPTANNTHQVAQAVAPECRIVYVDNDPIVLTHARALLTSTPEGATAYIDADLRDPDTILEHAARTLDVTQPIAIMLMGILGHIADDDQARSIVKRLVGGVPSGSYLTMNDGTDTSHEVVEAGAHLEPVGQPDLPPPQPRSDRSLLRRPRAGGARRCLPHDGVPSPARPASRPESNRRPILTIDAPGVHAAAQDLT
jgi:S-adenosyl methyltransferase